MSDPNQSQTIKRLLEQVDSLNRRIGDLRLLSEDKRVERIQLTKEHYPDILRELKEVRVKITDELDQPMSERARQELESFYQVIDWIFPGEFQKVNQKKTSNTPSNLSLYPNMQAHIQHKLK